MEEMDLYRVYVKADYNGYIIAVNSSGFLKDSTDWVEIDRGSGDRYHHAQNYYFPEQIRTVGGAYRYKMSNGIIQMCTPEEITDQEEKKKPRPNPTNESVWDELDAAYQEGVDSV